MKETRAYDRLKKMHPTAHWQRVEGYTTTGAFDVNGCLQSVEAWIECKQVTSPSMTNGKVRCRNVRASQIAWEYMRRRAGGRTLIALMVDNDLFILPGSQLSTLRKGVTPQWLTAHSIPPQNIFNKNLQLT